jgi:hypothetical protein
MKPFLAAVVFVLLIPVFSALGACDGPEYIPPPPAKVYPKYPYPELSIEDLPPARVETAVDDHDDDDDDDDRGRRNSRWCPTRWC